MAIKAVGFTTVLRNLWIIIGILVVFSAVVAGYTTLQITKASKPEVGIIRERVSIVETECKNRDKLLEKMDKKIDILLERN